MSKKKSFFRIKYYSSMAIALLIVLISILDVRSDTQELQFLFITLPIMIIALFMISIKCEKCGRGVIQIGEGLSKENTNNTFTLITYFPPKCCQKCGYERY